MMMRIIADEEATLVKLCTSDPGYLFVNRKYSAPIAFFRSFNSKCFHLCVNKLVEYCSNLSPELRTELYFELCLYDGSMEEDVAALLGDLLNCDSAFAKFDQNHNSG